MKDTFNEYLSGAKLYGDDFSAAEIFKWFNDEKDTYFNHKKGKPYKYEYHCLNNFHGYRFLKNRLFKNALGVGSAFGDEFMPILDRVEKLTILESSSGFVRDKIRDTPVNYVKAESSGKLPFNNNSFDLINCLGVLHHLPNVSFVLKEIYRCLKKDGYAFIREPIVSEGDWRSRRKGLTKRERGIPLGIFDNLLQETGFKVERRVKCGFPLIRRLGHILRIPVYNSVFFVVLDRIVSKLFSFNEIYHPGHFWQKLRPMTIIYLAKK